MARKLIVEVAADISQLIKGLRAGEHATETFAKEVTVDSRAMAQAQVAAAIKTTDALRAEVAAYREVAAAAAAGSKEQVAAAQLAVSSQRRLDASLAGTAGSARRTHGESRKLGRELEHVTRGAISGSGAIHGFGRSLAFASGGFVAFEGATRFLSESIDAAREAAVAQRSLAAQMRAAGQSFDANRDRIEKVALSYGKFGFQNDQVVQSLTVLERGTGSINKAISLQGLTADIARAKNLGLASAAGVVAKVFGGQETALRRAVPGLEKNAHGWDLIRLAQAKMAGQAAANATVAERFAATLHDTEEIVGTALLPTLNKYLTSLSQWLDKMNRSGELQRDVEKASHALSEAIGVLKDAMDALNFATGSTRSTLKLLFEAFVLFKTVKLVTAFADMAANIGLIGRNAETATGKVAGLNAEMGKQPPGGGFLAGGGAGLLLSIPLVLEQLKNEREATKKATEQLGKAGGGQRIFGDTFQGHKAGSPAFLSTAGVFKGQTVAVRTIDGQTWVIPVAALKAMMGKAGEVKPEPDTGFRAADLSDPTAPRQLKITAAQRNSWFDALIGRQLGRVSDAPLTEQLGMLQRISATITKRIAVTKDITRKLNLEDQLYAVVQQEKQVRAERQQAFFDRLQLNVDRTTLTKSVGDDLAALAVQQGAIEKAIGIQGHTLQLDQALLGVQQARASINEEQAAAAQASREAAQAERLAWADFAEERAAATPGLKDDLKAARAKLAILKEQAGTGKRTAEAARTIWEQEQKLNDLLKKRTSTGTLFRPVNAERFVQSLALNLSRQQLGRLTAAVAQLGPGAAMPVHRPQAFALAGGTTINIEHFHSAAPNAKQLQNELTRHAKSQPQPRRGAR
jgi:hypothetical protein